MTFFQKLGEVVSTIRSLFWVNGLERHEGTESTELKECFRYLNLTSRSFAAMIQQLEPDLRIPVCLFYLILRGLDTIEDDMTIDIEEKEPLLRNFHNVIEDESWTYDGNGPDEKDRELVVNFNVVSKEFNKISEESQIIIKDITKKMGNGMADYAKNKEHNQIGIDTIQNYEKYCHYVAGLVGEGLTRLFVQAEAADPEFLKRPEFMESMGQFLQQTNIIRDIREDFDEKRYFWPKEVWSKYVNKFSDLFLPENKEKAIQCQSELICNALQNAENCLFYMAGMLNSPVFKFVSVPQTMAIATLELCFQNYEMFERNIKISRIVTCDLLLQSSRGFDSVQKIFHEYAGKIRSKNQPQDPHFKNINDICNRIEKCTVIPSKKIGSMPVRQKEQAPPPKDVETKEEEKRV